MNREPKVGDVYKTLLKREGISYYRLYDLWGNRYLLKMIHCESPSYFCDRYIAVEKDELLSSNYQYVGKVAPRYKRLFGIYFIKDNTDD